MEVHLDAESEAKLSRVAAARFGADRARRTALEIVKAADRYRACPIAGGKAETQELARSTSPAFHP